MALQPLESCSRLLVMKCIHYTAVETRCRRTRRVGSGRGAVRISGILAVPVWQPGGDLPNPSRSSSLSQRIYVYRVLHWIGLPAASQDRAGTFLRRFGFGLSVQAFQNVRIRLQIISEARVVWPVNRFGPAHGLLRKDLRFQRPASQ